MKPPLFHVGQFVTPIRVDMGQEEDVVLRLKMGAIYTISWVGFISRANTKGWYIGCEEWPQDEAAHQSHFAPVELLPDEALAELLADVFEPVTL